MSLADRLDKIRSNPKQQSQQHTAVVLSSIDDTLKAQNTEPSPTAYFAALLSLLSKYISPDNGIANKDLAYAVVYLLDLVTPNVSPSLVRAKFAQILTSLAPALIHADAEAQLVRSAIGCLEALLLTQDAQAWSLSVTDVSPRRAIAGLLNLTIDARPKVRRRALDALTKILTNPPPSPSLDHPASEQCAEAALRMLHDEAQRAGKAKRGRAQHDGANEPQLIHALQLVKTVATAANGWPTRKMDALCELLLEISKSSHEYLVMAAFSVFEVIFEGLAGELSVAKLPRVLEVITELQPSKDDAQLLPAWIAILSRAYDVAAQIEPEETFEKLPALFESVARYLTSASHNIRVSASECLVSLLTNCVPASVILEPSIMDEKTLEKLAKVADDLLTVKYQAAWMEVFNVISAMFENYRWRSDPMLRNALQAIGDLRGDSSFAGKKEADTVISAAIRAAGPEFVLRVLPLNLAKTKSKAGAGRAWLLPLMRGAVRNAKLGHFRSELVPLSEVMFQRVLDHGKAEKTMEIKIYETIVQQVWATLPGYCDLPLDLTEAFDQTFAEMIANLLYQQPQLRTELCRSLQNLVVSFKSIIALESEGDDMIVQGRITKEQARTNLAHLATFAGNVLAVLFNVYSETLPQYRGLILQCIDAYLSIMPAQELTDTFEKVAAMLEGAIAEETPKTQADKQRGQQQQKPTNKMPPTSHTLMDLIITMSMHLPRTSFPALFNMAANVVSAGSDAQLQKKAYKLIPRLAESEHGRAALIERNTELQTLLLVSASTATAPARRDRLAAIAQIIPSLPSSDLHFIPSILSEVVIATKEVNEKARAAAFDTLVLMGERMSEPNGIVVNAKVPHMPADAPSVPASLDEYLTMVSAGLAGSTPHMISATITALSRLLYAFHSTLGASSITDLVSTIDLFLTSANREIVASCLGFAKVVIITLPVDIVRPRLTTLVPHLCVWSHEHKAHFRVKVKHIFERLVRRFGADEIERLTPVEDRKLIANIRKTKARQKRRRDEEANAGNGDDDDAQEDALDGEGKQRFESAYDAALASSDDDEDSDPETAAPRSRKSRGRDTGTFITEDADEPLDLLDRRALAHVSSTRPVRAPAPSTSRRKAKLDLDGKLVINEADTSGSDDNGAVTMRGKPAANNDEAGLPTGDEQGLTIEAGIGAYVDAIRSKDAARRGQRGKLKFKNVTRDDGGDDDNEAMDVDAPAKADRAHVSGRGRGGRGAGPPRGGAGRKIADGRRGLGVEKRRGEGDGGIRKRGGGAPQRGAGRGAPRGGGRGGFRAGRGAARGGRGARR